ncbi:MAG TPA: SCO family protein [Gammaproteobacteria bacterium]|nr:SCO family protein [Gammaproteobacteria bacterium]
MSKALFEKIGPPLLLLIVVSAAGAFFVFRPPAPATNEIEGLLWPPGDPLPDFVLRTQRGDTFGADNLKGRWSWMFFGYTECADICPTTLRAMNRVADKMTGDPQTQFIFVSIDPDHDSPEQMRRYLDTMAPKVIGLSGSADEISRLARKLGIAHAPATNPAGGIEHTAAILLIDPRARRVGIFTPPHDAGTLIKRFDAIRRFVAASR